MGAALLAPGEEASRSAWEATSGGKWHRIYAGRQPEGQVTPDLLAENARGGGGA